jgi:hypothetical protein
MSTNSISHDASQGPTPSSMMAWRVHEFGPPETMRFERVPVPDPGPGEVLVKVRAAGVGLWDSWIRAGRSALPQPLPLILGSDLSGESRPSARMSLTGASAIRSMVSRTRGTSAPTPNMPWRPRR